MSKRQIREFLFAILLFFLGLGLFFLEKEISKEKEIRSRAMTIPSPKKGVAGAATPQMLKNLNVSWFYNWHYHPGFKDSSLNWNREVWKKFVPLFYGKSYRSAEARIKEICQKTDYCHGGYYLLGNEPFNFAEDKVKGHDDNQAVEDAVRFQGEIIKAVRKHDPEAKFIALGLAFRHEGRIRAFIREWKDYWEKKDPQIADLPTVIKGWHFHTYFNPGDCPSSDRIAQEFKTIADDEMRRVYGKTIPGEEIWITEMGSLNSSANQQQLKTTMKCLVNAYENSSVVTRYAWFYFGCSPQIHQHCPLPWASYNLVYPNNAGGFSLSSLGVEYRQLGQREVGKKKCTCDNWWGKERKEKGDFNCDGQISLRDITLLVSCFARWGEKSNRCWLGCSANSWQIWWDNYLR